MKKKIVILAAVAMLCACASHRDSSKTKWKEAPYASVKQDGKGKKEKKSKKKKKDKRNKQEASTGNKTTPIVPAKRGKEYDGEQWVRNMSWPLKPTKGLLNKHFAVWASHGRYYDKNKDKWEWQRPNLYSTTEDLFTQTIVVPYLIPMLENAGATVFSPRERDWQPSEVIVDNDNPQLPYYTETSLQGRWTDAATPGFAGVAQTILYGNTNPFTWGTTRKTKAGKMPTCMISYQPRIENEGRYAVYVSYPTLKNSVDDAEYTVYHKGVKTVFNVNQRMGGGTWVYLGTFEFGKGCSSDNRVVLSNSSRCKGVVTADAVRFGGGMGTVNRNGQTSGMPRCLEGARYYAQWAGAPENVYNSYNGTDDYKDDINTRSKMTNWLAGGSCFVPDKDGKEVPLEMSLAVHSDAGYTPDFRSIFGSLAICTTQFHDGLLADGSSRQTSKTLAQNLLSGLDNDMKRLFGKWNKRDLYDRNYSETRLPEVPSAIIETLSHQSFPDMIMGQDPNVKFAIARSLYKTILKFTAERHRNDYIVQPLAPKNAYLRFVDEGVVELTWDAQADLLEPSAKPTGYIVYTAAGSQGGFDNGELVQGRKIRIKLSPDAVYRFRVTATNKGGESFPSETLTAVYHPGATKSILIVNGFYRLAAPAIVKNEWQQGFDLASDPGMQMGMTVGWSGQQINFDKSRHTTVGPDGLGYSGTELEGRFIMGNTFDYTAEHAEAMVPMKKYNVVSASSHAVENGRVNLSEYACVDLILGNQKYTSTATEDYKTFSYLMQKVLEDYVAAGGNILASGSYIASDMQSDREKTFLRNVLHIDDYAEDTGQSVSGMGTAFDIYDSLNDRHYAATRVNVVTPTPQAFCTLTYANGKSACVAYNGTANRTLAMGFPFECITSAKARRMIMRGFLTFLDE